MDNPAAKAMLDDALAKAEEHVRSSGAFDWIDVAFVLSEKFGLELPAWAKLLQNIGDASEPEDVKTDYVLTPPRGDFPKAASHDDQMLFILGRLGGTGSTTEVYDTFEQLAGKPTTKSKVRHSMMGMLGQQVERESPGPSTASNYWRLPGTPARPVTESKPKRTAKRTTAGHRNNGHTLAPRKPLPEGYNVNAKPRDKLQFIVFSVIRCFAVKNKVVGTLDDYEPGRYQAISVKQEITDMTRAGLFVKRVFGSDHAYGNPEWPNYDEDGTSIFSIPDEYMPEGHRAPDLWE